jgi:hypothetical protein
LNSTSNVSKSNNANNTLLSKSNGSLSALENKGEQEFNDTLPLSILPQVLQDQGQNNEEALDSSNTVTGKDDNGKDPVEGNKHENRNK